MGNMESSFHDGGRASLSGLMAACLLTGAVALVARKGKIVYLKAHGMADNQNNRALEEDAIFRIASQTKAITSTAVMMLWEEGRFQLKDPVSKFLPEFAEPLVSTTGDASAATGELVLIFAGQLGNGPDLLNVSVEGCG